MNDQNGYEVTHDRLRLYGNDIIRSVAFTDYEKSGLSKDEMIIAADGNRNMLISGRGTTLCDFGRVNGCSRINGCFTIANDTYLLTDKGVVCNGEVVGQERNAVKYYRISARRYLVLFDQTNESSAIGEVCIVENGQSNCVSYVKDNVSGRILDFCGDNNKLVIVTEDNIYVSSYDSVWYPVIGTTSDEEDETPQENTIIVDSICRTLDSGSQETELGVYVITKHIPVSQDDGDEIYHTIDCYPITNITIEYSQEGCEIPGTKDFSTEFPEFVPGIPIQFGGEVITLTSI